MTNLLKRYYRVFFTEQYIYVIDRSIDNVLDEIRRLLTTKRPLLSVPNITGRITKYSFEARPSWSFLVIKGSFNRDPAIISGDLIADSSETTRIQLLARPNLVFFIVYVGFTVIGFVSMFMGRDTNVDEAILGGLTSIFVAHTIVWYAAFLSKKFLRETFEDAMGVKPIATPQT